MVEGPVTLIFFSLTVLCCGSKSLAMMALYSCIPHMTPVGSDILPKRLCQDMRPGAEAIVI